jgi:LDH2 family malate/lactate/ureidoglycolate dehydrogenase
MKRYDAIDLENWVKGLFAACGVPLEDAELASAGIVRSELRGYRTHGMTRIASYVERLQSAVMNPRPDIRHTECPGGIVLDADGGMGHVAGPRAVMLAQNALAASASVLVAIQSCGHLGALGIHALLAAEGGAFCMIGQRTPPLLAMPGFARPAIGHNPIAFACPVGGGTPIVFDIACSVAARGKILLADREGRRIPEGWALDDRGNPTTDTQLALHGMLLPTGGHKGIGIAMMVECLAGALTASANALQADSNALPDGGAPGRQGAFLWLVRPGAFVDAALFGEYMSGWTASYLGAGGDSARLPGARGDLMERDGRANGIELPGSIEHELQGLGARFGVPFPI